MKIEIEKENSIPSRNQNFLTQAHTLQDHSTILSQFFKTDILLLALALEKEALNCN